MKGTEDMYVRNYGIPPRSIKREGETALFKASPPDNASEEIVGGFNATSEPQGGNTAKAEAPSEIIRSEAIPTCEEEQAERCNDIKVFGERGIPPQPLRRRKLIKRRISDEISPILDGECDIAVQREEITERDESSRNIPNPKTPCVSHSDPLSASHHCEERALKHSCTEQPKKDHGFSAEELFLGGLLLLMMGDHANDDILIMLAFLLFSGFKIVG